MLGLFTSIELKEFQSMVDIRLTLSKSQQPASNLFRAFQAERSALRKSVTSASEFVEASKWDRIKNGTGSKGRAGGSVCS
jgi:hypothetical protein